MLAKACTHVKLHGYASSALRCIVLDSCIPGHRCKGLALTMMQEETAQNRHLRGQVEVLETQLHSAGLQPADVEALDEPQVGCCSPWTVMLFWVCRQFLFVSSQIDDGGADYQLRSWSGAHGQPHHHLSVRTTFCSSFDASFSSCHFIPIGMGLGTYMVSAVVWLLDVAGLQEHGIHCMPTLLLAMWYRA